MASDVACATCNQDCHPQPSLNLKSGHLTLWEKQPKPSRPMAVYQERITSPNDPMKTQVRKAVFPVAGLGTRFLPATKALPKERSEEHTSELQSLRHLVC